VEERSVTWVLAGHSADAFLQYGVVEVEDQAGAAAAYAEIGQQLGLMNQEDPVDGLDLDDQPVFDDEIEPVGGFELAPL
jgi:hypothetical protein